VSGCLSSVLFVCLICFVFVFCFFVYLFLRCSGILKTIVTIIATLLCFLPCRNYDRPQLVEALKSKSVQEISCGSSHSAAVLATGELFTWGLGEYGRLGHGDNQTQLRPKLVRALSGHHAIDVACGSRDAQTLALTNDGYVWSWGDGDFGKLGRGGSEGCSVPHVVERLKGQGVCKVLCGAQFSLALTKSGQVWTW